MRFASFASFLFLLASGCHPSIGSCSQDDMITARTVVYDTSGRPAYAGQALMLGSCAGGGSSCHTDLARGASRVGAPYDLNFDPLLATDPSFSDEVTGATHLHDAQLRIYRHRDDIYATAYDGSMPPGDAGEENAVPYVDANGNPIPGLETSEGIEMLRVWLACGEPLIESEQPLPTRACAASSDCAPLALCDGATSSCINVGDVVPAIAR